MKHINESIRDRKGGKDLYAADRDIWFPKSSKLPKSEIKGYVLDCIDCVKNSDRFINNLTEFQDGTEGGYLAYVIDMLNIVARCSDKRISDIAADYLYNHATEELFDGMLAIAKKMNLNT